MEDIINQSIENLNQDELSKKEEDALFRLVPINETESEHLAAEPYSYWKSVFRVFIKKPSAIISLACIAILIICTIFVPMFAYPGATQSNINIVNQGVSAEHFFGTDNVGRDLFFCCFEGLSKSLYLAAITSTINIVVGTLIGLIWGYFRKIDAFMIELYNLFTNIPSLLLFMLLSFILSNAFPTMTPETKLILALCITGWMGIALFIRNQTLIITNREYNVASITLGTPPMRIMMRNLLPYLLAIIITEFSLLLPSMISSEVSMSYFGVGLPVDTISIGAILNNGYSAFIDHPNQLLAPAGTLAFVIFTFYLLGLALSDALDPKKHR